MLCTCVFTTTARLALAVGIIATAQGCGRVCGGSAFGRIVPGESTIAIGQSVTLEQQVGESCGPTDEQFHVVPTTWSTADLTIVTLDSLTGRVIGRAVGDAHVSAKTVAGLLTVMVHVR